MRARRSFTFFTKVGHLRPSLAILVPTCCQEVPNLTPRSPKRAQLVAKIAQNTTQEPPTRPPETLKMWPKRSRVVRFYTSTIFLKIAPKTIQNVQKSSPDGLKMAILAPTWRLLAPSWLQVGAILPDLGEILVDPSPAKIDQNQPRQLLKDICLKVAPKSSQTPSRPRLFKFSNPFSKGFR